MGNNSVLFFLIKIVIRPIKANNVVSSSPGINVHNYLRKKFSMDIDDEHATLLVGFNL